MLTEALLCGKAPSSGPHRPGLPDCSGTFLLFLRETDSQSLQLHQAPHIFPSRVCWQNWKVPSLRYQMCYGR